MFFIHRANMMNMCSAASATSAEAQSSCAQNSAFHICLILDAMTMASIIICLISLLALGLAGRILLAVQVLAVCMIILAVCMIILVGITHKLKWKHRRF